MNSLPEELKNDKIFKLIKDKFLTLDEGFLNAKDVMLVLGGFANDIQELQDFEEAVYSDISSFLFNFAVDLGNCTCTFYIAPSEDDSYIVTFATTFKIKGIYQETMLECLKKREGSQLKVVKSIVDEYYYFYEYDCDIKCFDQNGNLWTDIDTIFLENEVFSKEFDIPLEKAYEYRKAFKINREFLNQSRLNKGIRAMDNLFFSEKDGYLFSRPFQLIDLEDCINIDLVNTNNEDLFSDENIDVKDDDTYADFTIDSINNDRLAKILSLVQSLIGLDGEVVLSDNLMANLASYADNEHMTKFFTTGMIIKKVDGLYTLYYVNINENDVAVIGNSVSLEFVQELYKRNVKNETVSGLDDFFGLARDR